MAANGAFPHGAQRKGDAGGFGVVSCHVVPEGIIHAAKPAGGDKHKLSHLSVRFDGVLQVTAPDDLAGALESGIGPAKAFGFGLLSLAASR